MSLARQFVESRINKNRASEGKAMAVRKMLVQHNIIAGHGRSEIHVEQLRRSRSEAAERSDLFKDYSYVKGQQEQERKMRVAEAEERLAEAMAERKASNHREEMNRRRICDGSEELRSLKEKLHAAKVNKERAQQLLTLQVNDERDRFREHKIAEHMDNERLEHQELEHKLNIEKQKQRHRVKVVNQQQIAQKEGQREEARQEYLKEKDQVQELVEKIEFEDAQEGAARAQKKEETKETLRQFVLEQKARQEQLEQQELDENDAIAQYARDKEWREEQLAKQKEQEAKEKERILKGQIGAMEEKSKAEAELAQLRNDLHQEEVEAEFRRREELVMRKHLEDKEEMKTAYVVQMQIKEHKKANALKEEEQVREALLQKFAEDDRIEQMNEAKRRMKTQEHKREATRLIEIRRDMYEGARQAERASHEALRDEEQDRQVIIEGERQRLLKDHAAHLRDFLPKGTLECAEDFAALFPEARAAMEAQEA